MKHPAHAADAAATTTPTGTPDGAILGLAGAPGGQRPQNNCGILDPENDAKRGGPLPFCRQNHGTGAPFQARNPHRTDPENGRLLPCKTDPKTDFVKVVRLGLQPDAKGNLADIFCKVAYREGGLCIFGGIGRRQADIVDLIDPVAYAPGWDAAKVNRLTAIWMRWNENHQRHGSPAQERFLRDNPAPDTAAARTALAIAGLDPDPGYLRKGEPYRYASARLYEPVPVEALDWLRSLPAADRPAPSWL